MKMMKRPNKKLIKILAIVLALLMLLSVFVGFGGMAAFGAEKLEEDGSGKDAELEQGMADIEAVMKILKENFKDKIEYEKLIDGAMNGMVESLGDRWSVYYADEETADAFESMANGEYQGIGIVMSQGSDGSLRILQVDKKGPAYEAGVRGGDTLLAVDGESLEGKTSRYAATLLRGEKGSRVLLTVERDGALHEFELVRDVIRTKSVYANMLNAKDFTDDALDLPIGYIEIASFDSDTGDEFSDAYDELNDAGMKALIVDIRDNDGGVIEQALRVASKLIPERRDIMHYEQQGEIIKSYKSTGTGNSKYPVVLLVNEGSASASEILAGALKDTGAASLVGTKTYGKGVAQVIIRANGKEGKAVKFSPYYFLTADKHEINEKGVEPDVFVNNYIGERSPELIEEYEKMADLAEDSKPRFGDRDLNVYAAQQRLKMLGYDDIRVTGFFDEATLEAVQDIQKNNGLYVYGALDYTTMRAIEKAAYFKAYGESSDDMQLIKAVELLVGSIESK